MNWKPYWKPFKSKSSQADMLTVRTQTKKQKNLKEQWTKHRLEHSTKFSYFSSISSATTQVKPNQDYKQLNSQNWVIPKTGRQNVIIK